MVPDPETFFRQFDDADGQQKVGEAALFAGGDGQSRVRRFDFVMEQPGNSFDIRCKRTSSMGCGGGHLRGVCWGARSPSIVSIALGLRLMVFE